MSRSSRRFMARAATHRGAREGGPEMRRREFIAGLGSAAAWPILARAQQSTTRVIGFLTVGSLGPKLKAVLLQGLAETGYVEGRNLTIEFRFAQNIDQLPEMVADLVRRGVAVIVTGGSTPAALAAKAAVPTAQGSLEA